MVDLFKSEEFWYVTVLVGVAVNLVASAILYILKKYFSSFSRKRLEKKDSEKIHAENMLLIYSSFQAEYYEGLLELNHKKLETIWYLIMGCSMYLLAILMEHLSFIVYIICFTVGSFIQVESQKMIVKHGRFSLLISDAKGELLRKKYENKK